MGLRIPVQADMPHLGRGDQVQDPVHHAQAGPEDGNNGQLLPGQHLESAGSHRSLDLHLLGGQIPGSLIALQGGDLRDDLPELLHTGPLIPKDAQLVLKQRMVQNVYFVVVFEHHNKPLYLFWLSRLCRSRSSRSRSAWDSR